MNIFKKFKKRIEEKNKYKRLEKLFDEIVRLFPKSCASLMMHDINMAELDRKVWTIENGFIGDTEVAQRRNRNPSFDITLFGKDKI